MGLLLQIVLGGLVFYFIAIIFIGPALVPGLMSAGLIILALGSVKILKEKLGREEIIGILLMIIGVTLLGLSDLSIDVFTFNILDTNFIFRLIIFTVIFLCVSMILEIINRKYPKNRGIIKAIQAGLILSLNTIWASPGTTVVTHVAEGIIVEEEIIFGIIIGVILLVIVAVGITLGQISLKYGQANVLVPLTNVPIQILPVIAFFVVFLAMPSSILSLCFLITGFTLILFSSFLLSKRKAKFEEVIREK
jgi:drug/metabolite transporter (DMT)-like permease